MFKNNTALEESLLEELSPLQKEVLETLGSSVSSIAEVSLFKPDSLYLSEWESNTVVIDSRKDKSSINELVIDLDVIMIDCNSDISIFQGVYPLKTFPNLLESCKAYLNICLQVFGESSKLISEIRQNFNNILRFISWMIKKKGIYKFSDLTHDDFEDFISDFSIGRGWSGLHEYEKLFQDIVQKIKDKQLDICEVVSGLDDYVPKLSIKSNSIHRVAGLPISVQNIPIWFYDELVRLAGSKYYHGCSKVQKDAELSRMEAYNVFKSLNRLTNIPHHFDRPPTLPVPNADKIATSMATKTSEGRTKNLSIEDAHVLFKESLQWIYDYGPKLITILQLVRSKLENYEHSSSNWASRHVKRDSGIQEMFSELTSTLGFPFSRITFDSHSEDYVEAEVPSLYELTSTLMTACFVMVAVNHGRRLNEIVGEKELPYGLYFGCIRGNGKVEGLDFIDIYIEKTVKGWCTFYVNQLVKDAVYILEDLNQIYRPLNTPPKKHLENHELARKDKLFVMRMLSLNGFKSKPTNFKFSKHCKLLFKLAKVDYKNVDFRTHPFRRLFALLYYYRYDRPYLLALQQHLCHLDPGMTVVYLTDPIMRNDSDKIERLYRKRINEHTQQEMNELEDVRSELFQDTIHEILKGNRTSGKWPQVILPLYKQLSEVVGFNHESLSDAATITAEKLQESGYDRISFRHGGCNAGKNERTLKMSLCFDESDQQLHKEKASPYVCHSCIHFDQGETNLALLKQELKELQQSQNNPMLPSVVKKENQREADSLKEMITSEEKLSQSNRQAIATVVECFAKLASVGGDI